MDFIITGIINIITSNSPSGAYGSGLEESSPKEMVIDMENSSDHASDVSDKSASPLPAVSSVASEPEEEAEPTRSAVNVEPKPDDSPASSHEEMEESGESGLNRS